MNSALAVDWAPALVTLAIGVVTGAVVLWRARAGRAQQRALSGGTPRGDRARVRDLVARRDSLVRQLQELEDTEVKRTPEQLAGEREALELEAAHVLLALDAAAEPAKDPQPPPRRSRAGVESRARAGVESRARAGVASFFWGVSSATGLLLLVFFVWQSAKPRGEGGSVTGNSPQRMAQDAPPSGDDAELAAAVARNPSDLDAHLALAESRLSRRDLMGVWNEAARILELSPGNPRGLTYQAVVRLAMGQPSVAADLLRKAIAAAPDLIDAHAYLALAYARMGRRQEAESTVAAASRRFPDRATEFGKLLGSFEQERDAAVAGAEASPHADAPPASPSPASPAPPARPTGGRHVAGRIDVDPALARSIPPSAALFVYVRPAGVESGPPVAVKRLPPVFPASFDLSDANAMMGQPFPDPLFIEARLAEDGVPTTRSPSDPRARIDGVRAGRTDLVLVLKRP
jgi:tetratricopeptide (TPR) repeat protein